MPGSAYHVPTEEATLTAVAGRALQGLGCEGCARPGMGWYVRGTQHPALLGSLGIGAGSGRFNRAIARGIYQLPFTQASTPGSYGLGRPGPGMRGLGVDFSDPGTLLMMVGGGALLWWLFKGGRATRRAYRHVRSDIRSGRAQRRRLRQRMREFEA
jgi:hypothetical protein